MNNKSSNQLRQDARKMVAACRDLNFPAIVAHSPDAVARLRQVAAELNLDLGRLRADAGDALAAYARAQPPHSMVPAEVESERRRRCVEGLTKAGLGARLGKLYCSNAAQRLVPFKGVPHRRGLVPFDMVVAADYAPGEGYHGIFITATEILSGFLALPAEQREWQLRARAPYANQAQMVERVGLMSAGFPVG